MLLAFLEWRRPLQPASIVVLDLEKGLNSDGNTMSKSECRMVKRKRPLIVRGLEGLWQGGELTGPTAGASDSFSSLDAHVKLPQLQKLACWRAI